MIKDVRRNEDRYDSDPRRPAEEHRREDRRNMRQDRDGEDRRQGMDHDRRRNGHGKSSPRSPRSGHRHHHHHTPRRRSTTLIEDGEIEASEAEKQQEKPVEEGERPESPVPAERPRSPEEGERPPSPDIPPNSFSPEKRVKDYKSIKLKRYTKSHGLDYPAAISALPNPPPRPSTPPPPPFSTPPPRPPTPPLPPGDLDVQTPYDTSMSDVQHPSGINGDKTMAADKPVNRTLEATKSRSRNDDRTADSRTDQGIPVPDAPNRNMLNPSTRPTTAIGNVETSHLEHAPKSHRRPTADQELQKLHKEFKGTTTLAAYDVGLKLGEGTFG